MQRDGLLILEGSRLNPDRFELKGDHKITSHEIWRVVLELIDRGERGLLYGKSCEGKWNYHPRDCVVHHPEIEGRIHEIVLVAPSSCQNLHPISLPVPPIRARDCKRGKLIPLCSHIREDDPSRNSGAGATDPLAVQGDP